MLAHSSQEEQPGPVQNTHITTHVSISYFHVCVKAQAGGGNMFSSMQAHYMRPLFLILEQTIFFFLHSFSYYVA